MKAKPRTFSDQIRDAIERSAKSRYRIAMETGIDQGTLSRFINRKGGLSTDGLDRIADSIGLLITLKGE